jgi:hypothetical protein
LKNQKENRGFGGKLSNIIAPKPPKVALEILLFKTKNDMKTSKQNYVRQRKNITMGKIKPRMKQRVFKNEEIPI